MKRARLRSLAAASGWLLALSAVSAVAGPFDPAPAPVSDSAGDFSVNRSRIQSVFNLRFGYDDNINATEFSRQESGFINPDAQFTYQARSARATLSIGAGAGIVYYFDQGNNGREYDINANISVAWTYKVSPRLLLSATTTNLYQSQPDFNLVGLNTTRSGDYFYSSNRFALTYQWSRRFSTVTSYAPIFIRYADEPYQTQQDRNEHFFAQEFRFLLAPTISLVGEYRFGYVDYSNIRLDSRAHYLLAGIDATLSPRLRFAVRIGAEFRDYDQLNSDTTSPYAEVSASYDYMRDSTITLSMRYGIEQTDVSGTRDRRAVRLGITVRQRITPRISAFGSFYYTNGDYEGRGPLAFVATNFKENVYDVALGIRYGINRNWAVDAGYLHTTTDSDLLGRSYDRNRVYVGARFQF